MWTFRKKLWYALYKLFAAWLPISQRSRLSKAIRYGFAKHICTLGKNVNIERNAFFTPELQVGDDSGVGVRCEMNGPVTIGRDVMMGPEVVIYTRSHSYSRTDLPIRLQGGEPVRPVFIGDDCWIGRRAIIMPGVTIGRGCVIGAAAVVTKDVPDFSVVGGVPARILKTRGQELS